MVPMGVGRQGVTLGYACFFSLGVAFLANAALGSFPVASDAMVLASTVMYAKDKRNKRHAVSIPNVLGSFFPVCGVL
jgi:hypothetical protein